MGHFFSWGVAVKSFFQSYITFKPDSSDKEIAIKIEIERVKENVNLRGRKTLMSSLSQVFPTLKRKTALIRQIHQVFLLNL